MDTTLIKRRYFIIITYSTKMHSNAVIFSLFLSPTGIMHLCCCCGYRVIFAFVTVDAAHRIFSLPPTHYNIVLTDQTRRPHTRLLLPLLHGWLDKFSVWLLCMVWLWYVYEIFFRVLSNFLPPNKIMGKATQCMQKMHKRI